MILCNLCILQFDYLFSSIGGSQLDTPANVIVFSSSSVCCFFAGSTNLRLGWDQCASVGLSYHGVCFCAAVAVAAWPLAAVLRG